MKKRILSIILSLALCLSLLPTAAFAAEEITLPSTEGETIVVGETTYTYKGDYTSKSLNVGNSNFASTNCIFKAGDGYVLWDYAAKKATLHNATITTTSWVLEVPADAKIVLEGTNSLNGSGYAIVSYFGGINVTGTGSLTAQSSSTTISYAIYSAKDLSINISGGLNCGGINANGGAMTINCSENITITGLVRSTDTISITAGKNLSVTNTTDMAIQSPNGKDVTLVAQNGDITVNGGRDYSYQWYAIQANGGTVTMDASGNVSATGYDGYAGVNGSSLALSGTIPANTTLHSNCAVTVPAGKTLTNNGTLFVNSGGVSVAGTLVQGAGSSIKSGSSTIEPSITGSGSITEAPQMVDALDFRFEYNIPTTTKEYIISGGGTAKWEPGSNGAANKLTLNGVTMSGTSYLVGVPANTEIVLTGTNKITATNGDAIKAQATGAVLKITGTGSLEVTSPSSYYTVYGASGVDVDIEGTLKVNGQVRVGEGAVSVKSGGAITVNGHITASTTITAEAGTSLSITNTENAAVFATDASSVSLTAKNGDLSISGQGYNGNAIYGDEVSTTVTLDASGNVTVNGNVVGKDLNLSGTIPADTTMNTTASIVVPSSKTLINNGTVNISKNAGSVTVNGTLYNYGVIQNALGVIAPTGSGTIVNMNSYLDFTDSTTTPTGTGYVWNSETATLTLTDFSPSSVPDETVLVLPANSKLVLNGTNTLTSNLGAVIEAKGNLEISGTGTLNGTTGGLVAFDAVGNVKITDATVNLTVTHAESGKQTVLATNGNDLILDGAAVLNVSLQNNGAGFGIDLQNKDDDTSGDLTIGTNATVTAKAHVGILMGDSEATTAPTAVIAGTLNTAQCNSLCANMLGVSLNMEGSSITMKEGTHLWLYQNTNTLAGETNVKAFTGLLKVATGNDTSDDYYKVTKDTSLGLYAVGSTVSFTAGAEDGKTFTEWTAIGVTLDAPTASTISFTMPENDVTLTTSYSTLVSGVSLDLSEASITVGNTKTLVATIQPNNATNKNVAWSSDNTDVATVDENGVVTAKKAGTATITVTTVDGSKTATCVITVKNRPSYPSSLPPTTNITVPISGDDNTINVDASVSGSKATVDDVDLSKLNTVIGEDVNTGVVTIDFSGLNKSIDTVEIPSDVVKQIAEAVNNPNNDAESLEIVLSDGTSIEFDAVALGEKSAQANGSDITISIKSSRGNGAQQSVVGSRTAYDINVTSGGKAISDMGGMVTVHAPYELKSGELPRGVVVYYVDENGNKEACVTSYDSVKKRVNWKTDHLSLYMIGYDEELAESCPKDETCPMYPFTDVDVNAWYHDGVHYAIENGLMKGTSTTEKLFSPNGTTTRAQIVTILWRMENEPAVNYAISFEDVADGKWYTEAVRWAAANEIVFGWGGKFNPNDPITREQFAAILWRYAKYKGYDVSVGENTNILSYEDALTVSEYAVPAMQWVCGTGIIQGISSANGGMLLDPQGNAIRSQAATIIMRFDENVKK